MRDSPRSLAVAVFVALFAAVVVWLIGGGEPGAGPLDDSTALAPTAPAEPPAPLRSGDVAKNVEAAPITRGEVKEAWNRRRKITVRGHVTWPDGVGAHGTTVSHVPDAAGADATAAFSDVRTANDGSFELTAPSGVLALRAIAGDCVSPTSLVDARRGDVAGVGIAFPRLPRLRGAVLDHKGNPVVADVRVELDVGMSGKDGRLARSRKKEFLRSTRNGDFRRDVPARYPLRVRAFAAGYVPSDEHAIASDEVADDLKILLVPRVDVALRVVRPDGSPRVDHEIGSRDPRPEQGEREALAWSGRTDERGRLVLRDVPALMALELAIRAPKAKSFHVRAIDARAPDQELVVSDEELAAAQVDVVIEGDWPRRAGEFVVRCWAHDSDGALEKIADTDVKDGVAQVGELRPGLTYRFALLARSIATAHDKVGTVRDDVLAVADHAACRGEQRVVLPIEPPGSVDVWVRDAVGNARPDALVTCAGPSTSGRAPIARTSDESGRVRFDELLAGEYEIAAFDDVIRFAMQRTMVASARSASCILQRGR
ncbi:MAG: hypothetical protein HZB39_01065 [Planctomycetes bacterium]|nr:hypothetical protein [Planctomycetota bacterium]